mmetsp:Transcript_104603/g.207717  ORF Transcript_104603/g.207717 Transcript_104603/m.207717 type:complete len:200 (-) Transcript_104603:358-957(-)
METCANMEIEAGNCHPSTGPSFSSTIRKAEEEGINLYVQAPTPTFRETALGLHPPHGCATGFVQHIKDARRLDSLLARDFFSRPAWDKSTLPVKGQEDRRTLETISRQQRERMVSRELARRNLRVVGLNGRPPSSHAGIGQIVPRPRPVSAQELGCMNGYPGNSRPGSARAGSCAGSARTCPQNWSPGHCQRKRAGSCQ